MSIFSSLYTGASGMSAHGGAIGVVGDNIANVSTIGYKRNRAGFADVLGGNLAGQRLGAGVRLGSADQRFEQGSIQQTGGTLDMAVRGRGLFVVSGNHGGISSQYYTRDGRFSLDSNGFVVDPRGLRLQGYTIDTTGAMATSATDLELAGHISPPAATTTATMALNLDSNQPVLAAAWDPANPAATSNYSTPVTMYDSLGNAHHVDMYFRKTAVGTWDWHAMVDGGDITGGTAGVPSEIASGSLTFDGNGALTAQTTAASTANFVNATPGQVITFDFGDDIASGGTGRLGTQQNASTSTVRATEIDGHAAGNLLDVSVSDDGTITGHFDNGEARAMARVALAMFGAEENLTRAGDGLWTQSADSGQPLVDAAGSGGRGSISGGALEGSNVELGDELVTMIAYQRAFQANVKTVTTADEMLSEVANLKR